MNQISLRLRAGRPAGSGLGGPLVPRAALRSAPLPPPSPGPTPWQLQTPHRHAYRIAAHCQAARREDARVKAAETLKRSREATPAGADDGAPQPDAKKQRGAGVGPAAIVHEMD
jgi:hypothetical protein